MCFKNESYTIYLQCVYKYITDITISNQYICCLVRYNIFTVHIFSVNKQKKGDNSGDGSDLGNIQEVEFDLIKRGEITKTQTVKEEEKQLKSDPWRMSSCDMLQED